MGVPGCPPPEQLQQLLARQLDEGACAAVEAHVEGCPGCQGTLERLTDFGGQTTAAAAPHLGDSQFWRALKDQSAIASPRPPPGLFRLSDPDTPVDAEQHELTALLRRRLPVAFAADAAVFVVILLILNGSLYGDVLGPVGDQLTAGTFGAWGQALVAAAIIVLGGTAVLIWLRRNLSARALRALEALNFGVLIVLLSYWHYRVVLAQPPGGFEGKSHEETWILYGNFTGLFNWIMIMIQFALYLPQTPWRCAAFMAIEILAANLVAVAAGQASPTVGRMLSVLLMENAQGLLGGAALCVYSTVKARALERELRAARREARQLGQYHLKRLLGAGGMGEVYLAEHRLLKRPCAVKVIHPSRAGHPDALRRFEREVQATARLRHPNTVEVFDYGCGDDGTFYYVMEYLSGLSLDQLVKRHGPLPPARVVHLTRQLCGALREAHAAGLVHRDIKPGNVLVCRSGPPDRAKLLDFGLVHSTDAAVPSAPLTRQDHLLGTPEYMAPEQIEGATAVGPAADLYSLGAVTYFLLTGRGPFERDTPMRTLVAHLREPPVPPGRLRPDVPPALEAVVLRCLSKEPAGRFASAAELERALAGCAAGDWTEDEAAAWWDRHGRGPDDA